MFPTLSIKFTLIIHCNVFFDETEKIFFYHHNNVHRLTSYKYIKNKSNKARQNRTQNLQKTYTAYCKFCT